VNDEPFDRFGAVLKGVGWRESSDVDRASRQTSDRWAVIERSLSLLKLNRVA